jgi:hypothetical protein
MSFDLVYSYLKISSVIPKDDCKLVETLNKNINRIQNAQCFVFSYERHRASALTVPHKCVILKSLTTASHLCSSVIYQKQHRANK